MEETIQSLPKRRGRPKASKESTIKEYEITRDYYDKTPSVLIQSSLFGISEKRKEVRNYKIPTIGEIDIKFTGELFNQFDFDVFQAVIELAHNKEQLIFNFKDTEILKILDKKYDTSTIESVRASLHRLKTAYFDIKTSKKSFFVGSLFSFYEFDKITNTNQIEITTKTLDMFIYASTYDKEIRNKLRGNLSKFYYMFFCSHKNFIYNYKLKTYYELTNSEAELKGFKQNSKKAFEEINNKTDFNVSISENSKDEDIVIVRRNSPETILNMLKN
jgi:hypothetical protein